MFKAIKSAWTATKVQRVATALNDICHRLDRLSEHDRIVFRDMSIINISKINDFFRPSPLTPSDKQVFDLAQRYRDMARTSLKSLNNMPLALAHGLSSVFVESAALHEDGAALTKICLDIYEDFGILDSFSKF